MYQGVARRNGSLKELSSVSTNPTNQSRSKRRKAVCTSILSAICDLPDTDVSQWRIEDVM
jgi:hypothetical protein